MAQNITAGFFQQFLEGNAERTKPVLQIMELRPYNQGAIAFRARMSDSQFSYTNCIGTQEVFQVLKDNGITDGNNKPIIKVNSFNSPENNGKVLFCITSLEIVEASSPKIGDPAQHSGNPADYRGLSDIKLKPDASPSRKRPAMGNSATTPSKRSVPAGGVFSKRVFEVKDITPYVTQFMICGRISVKDEMREVNTKRGPMKIFNFTLTDERGDAIRIGCWSEQAEKFYAIVQEGEAYYINVQGGGTVKEANKRFNSTGHPYELSLNQHCEIEHCNDRKIEVAPLKFNVVPLADIKMHANECIDVLGVIDKVDDVTTVNSKDGRTLHRRNISIIDDSASVVQLTLWEDDAHNFSYSVGEVVGLKGASVREFNGGFSLGIQKANNQLLINPGGDTSENLQKWYLQERPNVEVQAMSAGEAGGSLERDFRLIGVVIGSGMAHQADDKGMYINVKGLINSIRTENAFYQSCKTCRKKVTVIDNQINCDRCGIQDEGKYVFMLSLEVVDFSGVTWATLFDEAAKSLLGISADDLQQISVDDKDQYEAYFDRLRFKEFVFRCRVKYEMFNDKQNLRWTIMQANPINSDKINAMIKKTLDKAENIL